MTADNVIYGVDFKAKVERVLTIDEQSLLMQAVLDSSQHCYDIDTAPSEYVAPSDDCA